MRTCNIKTLARIYDVDYAYTVYGDEKVTLTSNRNVIAVLTNCF